MEDKQLQIVMLGDFVIHYGDETLKLERTNTTKAMQALQLLLYYGEGGVPRDTLLDLLYNDDHAMEPANNLKVTISNLRRLLAKAGLPESTTIRFRGGSYFWCTELPMQLDIRDFERETSLAHRSSGQKQLEHCTQACKLYRGAFLPHLQGEGWAVAAGARYREEYFFCVKKLTAALREQAAFEQLLPVVTRAATLYGLEEFQLARIDCLMSLQRFAEAKQVYEETAKGLRDDFDLAPSEELLERCRQLDAMAGTQTASIQEFQESLAEEEMGRGAYYCAYPGFIDAYRVISRMLERSGQSAFLVMCWLVDTRGREISAKEKLALAVPKAQSAIQNALRRGDLFTQPARDRFLILLVGTNRENCGIVTDRIMATYKRDPARGISLSFRLAPVGDALSYEMFRKKPAWGK